MAENILLEIRGDIRDIKSKFSQVEGTVKKLSGTTQKEATKMSNKFQGLGGVLKVAFASAAIYKFTQGIKEAAKAASDLEEQTAKFKTVFRGSLGEANQDVKNLTDNFAMSEREAKEYMAAVQDLLVPMGMMRSDAAGLSGEIVKLSADLGSFNNMPTADVMHNIESAMTGQYRAIRKYGVVLRDSDVRQRAVNDGLADSADKVTALQKATTAYKMILEQTADAQGDMARTSDSFANTMKRLNAQMEDFKATIGKYIIPALGFWAEEATKVLKIMEELMGIEEKTPPTTMQDWIREKIHSLNEEKVAWEAVRYNQLKYIKKGSELARIDKELVYYIDKLNKFKKEGVNIDYATTLEVEASATFDAAAAEERRAKALEESNKQYEYLMGMLTVDMQGQEFKPIISDENLFGDFSEEQIKEIELALNGVKNEMSDLDKYAYQAAGAAGSAFAQFATGALTAEEAVKKLVIQMAALAAVSFIGGGWGSFLGGALGMLGAPAPSPIRKPKIKTQNATIGQKRQNVTMSTPMYGRRFIQEMNKNAVNVDSITAWSLG